MPVDRMTLNYPPEHFLNRELSLLQFQRRVLAQAADPTVPLLERLRFLCIVSSNLDEFFEIRVSGIKEQIRIGSRKSGEDGIAPVELLERVSDEVHEIISEQYQLLNGDIPPGHSRRKAWSSCAAACGPEAQRAWIHDYFMREVMPC